MDDTARLSLAIEQLAKRIRILEGGEASQFGGEVTGHAPNHLSGAGDEIDGDKLDIDYEPSGYVPNLYPPEVDSLNQLTSHLHGIGQALPLAGLMIFNDTKASGSHGGTFTQDAWQTRDINTEVYNPSGYATLNAGLVLNRITFEAGTYLAFVSALAADVDGHQLRLRDTDSGITLCTGQNAWAENDYYDASYAILLDVFTITKTTETEIQHRCNATNADDGFGYALSYGDEIYTIAAFLKMA